MTSSGAHLQGAKNRIRVCLVHTLPVQMEVWDLDDVIDEAVRKMIPLRPNKHSSDALAHDASPHERLRPIPCQQKNDVDNLSLPVGK